MNGGKSWVTLSSQRLHDPYSCLIYAVKKKLTQEPEWEWTQDYIDKPDLFQKIVMVYKTNKSFGSKYKFGIQAPRSVKHALQLDIQNGNNIWEEAINKELTQISDYGTFRDVLPGE